MSQISPATAADNQKLKLVVIGASQGTGKATVTEALARGHQVVAVSRHPATLGLEHANLKKLAADVVAPLTLKGIFDGADAVIIALGSKLGALRKDPTIMSRGTAYVMTEMRNAGVKKLVVLSSDGTGDSVVHFGFLLRVVVRNGLLRGPFADHDRQEAIVRASNLDWTIARPTRLTDGPAKHAYQKTTDLTKVPSFISRADTAHFMVDAAESGSWVGKAVCLGG
jgi:putative NADH-flavin reductase